MEEFTSKAAAAIGLDPAKSVFQVHGADESGRRVFARSLERGEVMAFLPRTRPAWWAWRRAVARITGRASCRAWATRSS